MTKELNFNPFMQPIRASCPFDQFQMEVVGDGASGSAVDGSIAWREWTLCCSKCKSEFKVYEVPVAQRKYH